MSKEKTMKAAMQAYIDLFNRSDADGIAALYADDATVEDPVGSPLKVGKAAITDFYRMAIKTGAKLAL
ncbi:MAG: nuclear transport factor 2 family protein, partial [Stenotrophobium sp.]